METLVIETTFGTLHCGVQGQGPPLVMVHASGMGQDKWAHFGAMMAECHTVYSPNLLGYGQTGPWQREGYNIHHEVKVIRALIEHIGAPVSLLGHSFGGAVALYTALSMPDAVHSVVLYEPTVFGLLARDDDRAAKAEIDALTQSPDFFEPAPAALEDWLGGFVDYWSRAPVWAFTSQPQRDALLAVGNKIVAEVREVLEGDHGVEADHVQQPTLVVCGQRTTLAARRMAGLLVARLKRGRLITLPGLGHMAPLHRPAPIAKVALAFLEAPTTPTGIA